MRSRTRKFHRLDNLYIIVVTTRYACNCIQSLQLSLVKQAFATKVLCVSSFFYEAVLRWKQGAKEYSEQRLFSYLKVGVYSNIFENLITIISVLRRILKASKRS